MPDMLPFYIFIQIDTIVEMHAVIILLLILIQQHSEIVIMVKGKTEIL